MTCLWMSQQCLEVTTRNVTNWIVYGDSVGSRQVTGKIGTVTILYMRNSRAWRASKQCLHGKWMVYASSPG